MGGRAQIGLNPPGDSTDHETIFINQDNLFKLHSHNNYNMDCKSAGVYPLKSEGHFSPPSFSIAMPIHVLPMQ